MFIFGLTFSVSVFELRLLSGFVTSGSPTTSRCCAAPSQCCVPVKANQISIHVEDRSLVFGITLSRFKSSTARSKAFTPHLSAISGQLSADDLHHACNMFSSSCLVRKNTHSSLCHTLESPFIFKHIGGSVNLLHFPGITFRHNLTSFNPLKIIVIFLSINE